MADSNQSSPVGIRTHDQRLRVFVSSTLEELEAERRAARAAIEQLRLHPVMFESGASPHPARALYRAFLDQSDVFVGIYWQSYGWVAQGSAISGLEDEFRLASQMPRLVYVKIPAPGIEPMLSRMLEEVRTEGGPTYKTFADAAELRELLANDLAMLLSERFGGAGSDGGGSVVPVPVTVLVGRDGDVAQVADLVSADGNRLVVLTGAGGVGKTRLALAVLEQTRSRWVDGVAFADLSRVTDPSLVPEAIAVALGFRGQGREDPLDILGRRLAGKHMLVVLDDFDQVLAAAPVVPQLLQRAPQLHLLVTSRVVLRVRGEREWRVAPLGLPPGDGDPAESPAVCLLVERARDVQPGFELTSGNTATIVEVCRRLDGLPLALELAATWLRLLTPQQLLQQLAQHMERRGALVDVPERQQTMTATIGWSYDLLPEPARELLARLTVFAAPFTMDAAEAVSGQEAASVAEVLAVLLDHNMVSPAERLDGERAFRLLNMIHHYAAERLKMTDDALCGLASYLLGVLERASFQHGSQDWSRRLLDSETPNLQVILTWAAERRQPSGELLRRLGEVWGWLLARGSLAHTSGLTKLIQSWPAAGLPSESDTLARDWLIMVSLVDDPQFAARVGELIDRVLPDARRLEQPSRWAMMLMIRAAARPYAVGSPARAEYEEALAVARRAGDLVALGYILSHFGLFLNVDGDLARAQAMHEEMLAITRSLADQNQHAEARYDLALDALGAGDAAAAQSHLAAAARRYSEIHNLAGMARCLGALAEVAREHQRPHLAARLVGAAAAARAVGLAPGPLVEMAEGRITKSVQAALSDADFNADVAQGRAETPEAALAAAWAALEAATEPVRGSAAGPANGADDGNER
jgi:predicted ATPase